MTAQRLSSCGRLVRHLYGVRLYCHGCWLAARDFMTPPLWLLLAAMTYPAGIYGAILVNHYCFHGPW
jgi:hypothetical protein